MKTFLAFLLLFFTVQVQAQDRPSKLFWASEAFLVSGFAWDLISTHKWIYSKQATLIEGNPAYTWIPQKEREPATVGVLIGTAAITGYAGYILEKHNKKRASKILLLLGGGAHLGVGIGNSVQGRAHQVISR